MKNWIKSWIITVFVAVAALLVGGGFLGLGALVLVGGFA